MQNSLRGLLLLCLLLLLFVSACRHDKGIPTYNGFPEDVGKIFFTKCATAGCHTDASKDAAAGLSLESWDKLFEGGKTSAAVIPYRHDQSTLAYYVNTFSDLGNMLVPTMPFNNTALSREEVTAIINWINTGATNNEGFVKFSDNPNRKKIYVTNQGCDMVTVFDAATLLPMRYINVGNSGGIESPHMVKVSPDGQYWYVLSLDGTTLQKHRTSDDSFVGEATIGSGYWNTMTITPDGSKAFAVDWSNSGKIVEVDLNILNSTIYAGFNFPHGSCLNPAGDTLYITQQNGSKLYKIPVNDFSSYSEIDLYTTFPSQPLWPHEVLFSPDGSEYYVTCQGLGGAELRILQQGTDQLLDVITLGGMPSEMAISTGNNYLFITCTEDTLSFSGKRGSVYVINITDHSIEKKIYTGHQPHGIAVDDESNKVYVANRNVLQGGPAPHHSSSCAGKNGYVTFIDMGSLTLVQSANGDKKVEVSVDPYSVAVRH